MLPIIILLYIIFYLSFLLGNTRVKTAGTRIFYLAVTLQALYTLFKLADLFPSGLTLSFYMNIFFLGMALAVIYWLSADNLNRLVTVVTPVIIIGMVVVFSLQDGKLISVANVPVTDQFWVMLFALHIVFFPLSYVAFFLSGLFDLLYLVIGKRLKDKKIDSWVLSFPSIESLYKSDRLLAGTGIILYVTGIVIGMISQLHLPQAMKAPSPVRVIYSLLVLAVFIIKYVILKRKRQRGHLASIAGLIGILLIIISFLGLNFHIDDVHTFKLK